MVSGVRVRVISVVSITFKLARNIKYIRKGDSLSNR